MINLIRKITIFISIVFLVYLSYEFYFNNSAKEWKNYKEPKEASFQSLEQDEDILKDLKMQIKFNGHKSLNPEDFVKVNIFQTID